MYKRGMNCVKPRKITTKEKYGILGKVSDNERVILSAIINRSAKGLWTTFRDIDGATSVSKRLYGLMDRNLGLKSRSVDGIDAADRPCKINEYCF